MSSQTEFPVSAKAESRDGMKRILDDLLHILREEIDIYTMVLNLARDENDAMLRSDLNALRTATDGKSALIPMIQGLEQKREALIDAFSEIVGRPVQEMRLYELSRLVEEPFATQLETCRSHLIHLAASISDTASHNREVITHRLRLIRSSFSFLNQLSVSTTVYHNTGRLMMASDRSGRVLSGNL